MIQQAAYLGIVVEDIEAATAYYRDTLGLEVNEPECIPGFYTQFKLNGGAIFSLQANTEMPNGQSIEPAFVVDDADATYADWQEKDVDLLDEPNDQPYGRTFLFRTPEGHVFRAFTPA